MLVNEFYINEDKAVKIKFNEKVAVFAHLYYFELVDYSYSKISDAALCCDVYVTTSNPKIYAYIKERMVNGRIYIRLVKNRGYDIASLVVHCRNIIKKYEFFCFVHDKRSLHLLSERDGQMWNDLLWENTLNSANYIEKVINIFEDDNTIGVLTVPEPYWGEFVSTLRNSWENCYNAVCNLLKLVGINCSIKRSEEPITLGTAFWARTEALRPLLSYNFKINDFPKDGVGDLSYAIERSFSYISENQGFSTGIICTNDFASKRSQYMQNIISDYNCVLQHRYSWNNSEQITQMANKYRKLDEVFYNSENVFIFGTGQVAKNLIGVYPSIINKVTGFVVSNDKKKFERFMNKDVFSIDEIAGSSVGFILAVKELYKDEIIKNINNKRFPNVYICDCIEILNAIN